MNAAVLKRGRRYAVGLDLGRGPGGRRIYKWHSGYPTKRAAQQARTELLGALDHNTHVPPDTTTLAHYLRQQWLPTIATQVRPGTWAEYRSKAQTHLLPPSARSACSSSPPPCSTPSTPTCRGAAPERAPCGTSTPPSARHSTTRPAGAF